jgi:hypothetical protein
VTNAAAYLYLGTRLHRQGVPRALPGPPRLVVTAVEVFCFLCIPGYCLALLLF